MSETVVAGKKPDWLTMFRASATSLSSGLLLILIGGSLMTYILGIFFMVMAVLFLIGGIGIPWISSQLDIFNKNMAIIFLEITALSILRNWTNITNNVDGLISSGAAPNWLGQYSLKNI
jgi:hypothetical protein